MFISFSVACSADDQELNALLEGASEQISSNNLNIDYTPSTISILKHEQLRLLGVKDVFEALSLIPGIQTSIDQIGTKKVIVRGLDSPNNYTSDKMRLQIDGVPIDMAIFSSSSSYLQMPIDIVERIEVLRGPASALYGSGAFSGVINIVTRRGDNALFIGAGSYEYYRGGVKISRKIFDEIALDADAYLQKSDKHLHVDSSYVPDVNFQREHTTNEKLDDYSLALSLAYRNFYIKSRLKEHTTGNFYGWGERLELTNNAKRKERYTFIETGYKHSIDSSTTLDLKASYSEYKLDFDGMDYVIFYKLAIPYLFNISEKERGYRAKSTLSSSYFNSHQINIGVSWHMIDLVDNYIDDNASPYGKRDMIDDGLKKEIASLYINDTFTLNTELILLLAVRAEYYVFEQEWCPSAQFGLVYEPLETLKLKLNYGHSFRTPSWIEQYTKEYGEGDGTRAGNRDLKAEQADTVELVAIFANSSQTRVQLNTYYTAIANALDIDDIDGGIEYSNGKDRDTYGAELALDLYLLEQDRFHIDLSYTHSSYTTPDSTQTDQLMPTVSSWMATSYYIHFLTPSTALSLKGIYIGDIPRNKQFDHRETNIGIDSYITADATLSYQASNGLNLRATVNNMFDESVKYPSYYARHPGGNIREGRNFYFEAEYLF